MKRFQPLVQEEAAAEVATAHTLYSKPRTSPVLLRSLWVLVVEAELAAAVPQARMQLLVATPPLARTLPFMAEAEELETVQVQREARAQAAMQLVLLRLEPRV